MSISKTNEISMLQISDSFFPNGMYSTSNGLEALFYSKRKIVDAEDLRELLKVYLECLREPIALLLEMLTSMHKEKICRNY